MPRTAHPLPDTGRIVVGVDGSASSKEALAWAARQARLTGSRLFVIATWHVPMTFGWSLSVPQGFDPAADMTMALASTVAEVLGPDPGIEVSSEVIQGHPQVVLTEQSRNASLIVVGSRGHGEFAGMLLGSVSEFLTTHAHCPVVVIREREDLDESTTL
jgi:nucleotide-binding universal stress UspA family protein